MSNNLKLVEKKQKKSKVINRVKYAMFENKIYNLDLIKKIEVKNKKYDNASYETSIMFDDEVVYSCAYKIIENQDKDLYEDLLLQDFTNNISHYIHDTLLFKPMLFGSDLQNFIEDYIVEKEEQNIFQIVAFDTNNYTLYI